MENTPRTSPLDNTSFWSPTPSSLPSSVLPLCPTGATLFLLPSLYALLFLTGFPGNALSLWVFLRRISTKTPTHVYLSHLSVSNLLLSLTTPFLAAYYARGPVWPRGGVMCQLVLHSVTPVLHINIYIGVIILTWVALSRFAGLIRHTHASRPSACTILLPRAFFNHLRRASFACGVCAAVWVVAVGGIVPVTVYYSVKEAGSGSGAGAGEGGGDEKGGGVEDGEVCYNPAVEIGGSLSTACYVPAVTVFFVCFLLVLLSYMTVLRHIRRSRRSTNITVSHSLLGKVLRNIVVIQVVLIVCLLPHHVFKPIFISLVHEQRQLSHPAHSSSALGPNPTNHCHPLSTLIELKNCLLLLAALRGSTDPVMYFLLDKTFRKHTLSLFRRHPHGSQSPGSVMGRANQKCGQLEVGTETPTVDWSHETIL
ncbi:putative G-protein coupled receptor 82 [Centroberyx gerrardi]